MRVTASAFFVVKIVTINRIWHLLAIEGFVEGRLFLQCTPSMPGILPPPGQVIEIIVLENPEGQLLASQIVRVQEIL